MPVNPVIEELVESASGFLGPPEELALRQLPIDIDERKFEEHLITAAIRRGWHPPEGIKLDQVMPRSDGKLWSEKSGHQSKNQTVKPSR